MSYPLRRAHTVALLIVLAAASVACGRPRPNLLLVSMDTTRSDFLGAYGRAEAQTPVIDGLAAEGFLFRQHLTPVPITLPAHTSLLTGLFPPVHTVRDNGTFYVPQEMVTLAEVLRDAGYDTSAFVGSFPLSKQFQLDQGFALYDDNFAGKYADLGYRRQRGREDLGLFFDERPAGEVVDAAIAHHQQRSGGGPFFTFLHFFDPHQPLEPPAPYDLQFRRQPYDGEIAYVDSQIGRFLEMLKERSELDNTVVVITADHGEGMGEHGELTHAMLLHQATLHIPLVLHGPGVPQGETGAWTSSTQVYATLLDLLGVEAPPEVASEVGTSLVPLMANGGEPTSPKPFTAYFETLAPRAAQGWSQLTGWMWGDWRYIHAPRPQLFDLAADPKEADDRYGEQPELDRRMLTELSEYLTANESLSVGEAMQTADEETLSRLAALGYLQHNVDELTEMSDMLEVDGLVDPKDRVVDIGLFSEAKAALARGNWNVAHALFKQLVARSPENVVAYQSLATLYGQIGQWDKALEMLDIALAARPGDRQMLGFLGQIYVELGRYREGIDVLSAIPDPEGSVEACTWIGWAHQQLGEAEEAERWYRAGLKVDPHQRWLRLYLANQLASEKRFDEAESLYKGLITDAPYFHLGYYNYGLLLMERGDREAARGLLQRAADLAPRHAPSQAALKALEEGP